MTRQTVTILSALITLTIGCAQEVGSAESELIFERFENGENVLEITALSEQARDGLFEGVEIAYFDGRDETVVVTDLGDDTDPNAELAELMGRVDPRIQDQLASIRDLENMEITPLVLHSRLLARVYAQFPAAAQDLGGTGALSGFDTDCLAATGTFYECLGTVRQ